MSSKASGSLARRLRQYARRMPKIAETLMEAADRIDTLEQAIHLKPRVAEGPPARPVKVGD